tara:strand:+ start:161 stop:361 length:201 start_codon:yes stop_codon:yes gene_type:complete
MGNWEDFWWETHKQLEELGLQKKFEAQLDKMRHQDKHKYKDSRDRWDYALGRVLEEYRKSKKDIIK